LALLKRIFCTAPTGIDPPFDIKAPFHPFVHQYQAWRRLSTKDQSPQNTIVTTGAGSGKTECFLIPVLDHCRRAKKVGQKGVKAGVSKKALCGQFFVLEK
jgi:DEAD/DEAH box helicase domain-containing protein